MATLLIFDTTGAACSAAVWSAGTVAAARHQAMTRGQSETLLPMIGTTLDAAGLSYDRLDAIAVTTGPGTFTGIRIGLSAARGLALALEIPAFGLSSFEALAVRAQAGCVLAINTRRHDYYCQTFDPGRFVGRDPAILPATVLLERVAKLNTGLVTDDPDLAKEVGDAAVAAEPPDAAQFAGLAATRFAERSDGAPYPPLRPYYMRAPLARLPEKRA